MVKVEFEHDIDKGPFQDLAAIRRWLRAEFGKNVPGEPKRWMISYYHDCRYNEDLLVIDEFIHYSFYFRDERMVMAFLLRWS